MSGSEKIMTGFERIGGTVTVRRAVDRLYFWIYRDDELYLRYFQDVDLPALKAHMVSLLSHVLGGPRAYDGRDLTELHRRLKVTPAHYDRVRDYVVATLLVEHAPRTVVSDVDGALLDMRDQFTGKTEI